MHLALGTLIPASIILLTAFYDVVSVLSFPPAFRNALRALASPFHNFLTLDDVEGPVARPCKTPPWKIRTLVALACIESVGWLSYFAYALAVAETASVVQGAVAFFAWVYAASRIVLKPPSTPPYLLILFSVAHVLAGAVDLVHHTVEAGAQGGPLALDIAWILFSAAFIWLAGTLPLQVVQPAENVAREKQVPSSRLSMPEDNVDLWSWSTFSFVQPIFDLASTRRLDGDDIWTLSPYFRHKNLFRKYLEYRATHPAHGLLRFLLVSNSLDLILDIVLELWSAVVGFVPPYALQQILSALATPTPSSRATAYYWALVTFIAHLSFAQKDLLQCWHTRRCYERTRGQLFCALHWKALKRQDVSGKVTQDDGDGEKAKGSADLGVILNLMQGDTYAVSQRFWEFSAIFASPVRLVIALVFLYNVLGWSALTGVVVVLVAYALNYPLAKYNIYITRRSWKAKDARMNVVNELLQNIRFLKFYGWENHWARKSRESRETELGWRIKENVVDTVITFIWTWIPSAIALTSFLCYTLVAGERLTVAKAFTSIALFSQLQGPMMVLPGQFFAMLHAYVSMQRINDFLAEDEVPAWASSLKNAEGLVDAADKIGFREATFEWHGMPKMAPAPARFELGPLDIEFPKGELTLVSGNTGSGKTALLAALLGEMHCRSGAVFLDKMDHQVAYCAQNPWLEHATIRDNIIFGSKRGYDEERYNSVVEACALSHDLEVFDAGDLTEIGEKGITLSGGQRARIALARAVYSEAKVILLDDPLAAVDMHTAQHIVSHCLTGSLARDRTIILVTHHISLCLPISSYLVELSRGKVLRKGTIREFEDLGQLQKIVEAEDDVQPDPDPIPVGTADLNEVDFEQKVQKPAKKTSGKLIEAEARAEGRVSYRTYWTYIRAAGIVSWVMTLLLMLLIRFINIGNQVFLAKWGEAYHEKGYLPTSFVFLNIRHPWGLPSPDDNVRPWLMVYLYISLAGAFSVLAYISIGYYASLQASRSLFISLLNRLTRAPARFFDVTPIGRILNRFTTDINTVDGALQNSARDALSGALNFLASFIVIISVVPTFTPFALFIAWLYIRLAPPYIRASRDLRRLESVSLSPAFAGFDELLRGLAHVRAFAMEGRYQDSFYKKVDTFQTFDHVYWLVSGWLQWRYDCLGSVVVFLTTLFALWKGVTDGWAALVIVQAGTFAEASRQLVRVAAQLELDFNSVERIVEYLDVPQEAPPVIEKNRPPAYWPSTRGGLVFEDLVVRYAPDLPVILQHLSFTIKPSEKIAVVGRTGSGKSTLALSLLRMVEPSEGRIIMDGIDISTIGLEDLRTRITIVSQDVSLFSGTIRSNLDPFEEHTDRECWDVLDRCHLTSSLGQSADRQAVSLDMPMSQGGSLSAGERQLVALARAVLRRTNIVIMDEATSQIDSRLDDQIQKTIREELSDALVITIAHRLKTIVDYDRVLVLDAGRILEFGEPRELLKKSGSSFREMCRRSADWPLLEAAIEGKSFSH